MKTSKILDKWGNPINVELDEPQTESSAKLAQLHNHYGEHPSGGLTPSKAAHILREAERGQLIAQCELAEDIEEKDAHVQSELGKRRLAMQSVPWNIVPPPNASAAEQRDAEMIEELLRNATWLDEAIFDAGDGILKGFSNQELIWDFYDNTHVIEACEYRDPSWFQVNPDNRNQITLRDGSHQGEALRPFGWLAHQHKSKSGYLSRHGLIRVLVWPFLFKNYSVRDLAEFLEIYGLPLRLGKYPAGATEKEKMTLLRAVMSIGHNAGGIIPKGMELEFEKAADGASDPFMAMINWCEKSQSKAILGGTLTSQADGKTSTNALGNVHNEVRTEIRDADLKQLQNTLTRDIVYPLYALNGKTYQNPRRCPRFEFDTTEPEDIAQLADPLSKFVEMGMRIPTQWLHEKTKIPVANKDEAVLSFSNIQPVNKNAENAALRNIAVLKQQPEAEPDSADLLTEQLKQKAAPALNQWLGRIEQMVEDATSLQGLMDELLTLEDELSDSEMISVMQHAFATAELAGRFDVQEGE
ncbi:DUF935 domain-containing protein [Catenovulum sediminis]|uniref:DUF935 domain-containing protein n=1 Tax=Catenovulum sediminis TaxID=1740262 RepID=UPI001180583A|nr:DUF935 domain-containing protein [Catenovulum sediminis]